MRRRSLLVPALLALAALVPAHVRLVNPDNGMALYWTTPGSIPIVIQAGGSDDIPDGSHATAIRSAIQAWNAASGSAAHFVENTSPAQQARTDWESDSLHLVMFDEHNDSGFFPSGCGIVAITPVSFSGGGSITDADVLFNGRGFRFTTALVANRYDVQDVAAHELGHVLGLDHSAWAGASMYPYVDPTVLLHRSLSQDELHGLRQMYPAGTLGRIHGSLQRSDGRAVKGAHVVALDAAGRPCAAALSSSSGAWRIYGLEPGSYTLYAEAVDSPVNAGNFGAGHPVQVDFRRTELGPALLSGTQDIDVGSTIVLPETTLEFGRVSDDFPKRVVRGIGSILTLHGSGLVDGSTLACSDPGVSVVVLAWNGSRVQFSLSVPPDQPDGHLDLVVTNPQGEQRTLVAGLEVTPPDPRVDSVVPAQGTDSGGTLLTLTGANFRAGQQVVLGGSIYPDGVPGGCEVLDASTIRLHTQPSRPGSSDVVVIDTSGVEGRKPAAFTFAHVPEVQSIFPSGGYAGGGTEVVLRGQNFAAGAQVRIDGVPQAQVLQVDETELRLTTQAGIPGGPYLLEVENPGGAIAQSAFSYAAAPDPLLEQVSPDAGPPAGGNTLRLHGANLSAVSSVLFGADPATGQGGTPAAGLSVIDAETLEVVAPAHAPGPQSLLLRVDATGQAVLLSAAYTFDDSPKGGGCSVLPQQPPAGPREILAGAWWLLALLVALHLRAWQRATSSPSTSR